MRCRDGINLMCPTLSPIRPCCIRVKFRIFIPPPPPHAHVRAPAWSGAAGGRPSFTHTSPSVMPTPAMPRYALAERTHAHSSLRNGKFQGRRETGHSSRQKSQTETQRELIIREMFACPVSPVLKGDTDLSQEALSAHFYFRGRRRRRHLQRIKVVFIQPRGQGENADFP